jgi:hypothetical protein
MRAIIWDAVLARVAETDVLGADTEVLLSRLLCYTDYTRFLRQLG